MERLSKTAFAGFLLLVAGCATPGTEAHLKRPQGKGPVSDTIRQNQSKFDACIAESVSLNGGENIQLILTFTVSAQGRVVNPEIERMSTPDPDFGDCIIRKLRRIEFPKPNDGKPREIRYPLIFTQANS